MYTCRHVIGICIRADIYYGQCICIRADILQAYVYVRIYIFNAPEAGSAYVYVQIYYGHMYTCMYILWADILKVVIFLMLLRLAYHLLLDST